MKINNNKRKVTRPCFKDAKVHSFQTSKLYIFDEQKNLAFNKTIFHFFFLTKTYICLHQKSEYTEVIQNRAL